MEEESKEGKERRKFTRVYRNFILNYYDKDNSTTLHEVSQVNNVSKGGLNFSTTHPLNPGEIIKIDLKTPFVSDSIHLEGVVLSCKEKITDMIYEIRLEFKDIPKSALTVLEKIESYGNSRGD